MASRCSSSISAPFHNNNPSSATHRYSNPASTSNGSYNPGALLTPSPSRPTSYQGESSFTAVNRRDSSPRGPRAPWGPRGPSPKPLQSKPGPARQYTREGPPSPPSPPSPYEIPYHIIAGVVNGQNKGTAPPNSIYSTNSSRYPASLIAASSRGREPDARRSSTETAAAALAPVLKREEQRRLPTALMPGRSSAALVHNSALLFLSPLNFTPLPSYHSRDGDGLLSPTMSKTETDLASMHIPDTVAALNEPSPILPPVLPLVITKKKPVLIIPSSPIPTKVESTPMEPVVASEPISESPEGARVVETESPWIAKTGTTLLGDDSDDYGLPTPTLKPCDVEVEEAEGLGNPVRFSMQALRARAMDDDEEEERGWTSVTEMLLNRLGRKAQSSIDDHSVDDAA